MNNTNKNIINILNIIPDDILEKIFCIKPCINKKLQKYFNNNIEKLYNEFIKTTKNDRMIKLHIIQEECIMVDYNNFIEKINDENYFKKYMSRIEYIKFGIDYGNRFYNDFLNKYKIYNNVFSVNYFYDEFNHVSYNFSDENNDGIFIWRVFNYSNSIDSIKKKCILYHDIIKKFILILTKNFYKLFIDGDIIDYYKTIQEYIRNKAKLYIKNIPLKHSKKLFNFFKKNVENTIDFSGNYYYDLENILCFVVDSYITSRPLYNCEDEDNYYKNYQTYESFKIQNRLYNNISNKGGLFR